MLLTLTTTHRPATDLGYLLVKHPDRQHSVDVPTGTAHVFFPVAGQERCTAALLLDVDPVRLSGGAAQGRGGRTRIPEAFALSRYVNDRPYAASSLLASALARLFRSALRGESRERPELAATPIPLEIGVPALRCRGGAEVAVRVFEPLGWTVTATPVPLDETRPEWGDSRYVQLTLTGTARLADALSHLYVLLPVLDDAKHYWVASDEVDKLIRAGTGWLAGHPERSLITRRYLAHRRALATAALSRLDEAQAAEALAAEALAGLDEARPAGPDEAQADAPEVEEAGLPESVRHRPLAATRRSAVLDTLAGCGATRVLDLGCGAGALLAELVGDARYTEIVGTDVAARPLELATRRLRLDRLPAHQRSRVRLWQSALTYRDDRLRGYDAAVLMEVIEHVDPPRLPALAEAVFGHAQPRTVIVTTPNVEYNVRYPGLPEGALRHADHRFEWSRAEFAAWTHQVAGRYGYRVRLDGVGEADPEVGCPTQMAVFTRASDIPTPAVSPAQAGSAQAGPIPVDTPRVGTIPVGPTPAAPSTTVAKEFPS